MKEITQENLEELKTKIKIEKPLNILIQENLKVGIEPDDELLKAQAANEDTQTFSFDIKIISFSGSISESGRLDFKGSVIGIEIGHTTADLSKGQFCQNPKLGKFVGVKYCFSLKNKCLYTSGEIDGWFRKRTSWNQKILCF